MTWKLLTDFNSYIFGWLVGYSGFLGPIAGVMITDYFLVRRTRLEVNDLYRRNGCYEYRHGLNVYGVFSLGAGIVMALVGLVVPPLHWLYSYSWFVGFAVAGLVYYVSMQGQYARTARQPAAAVER